MYWYKLLGIVNLLQHPGKSCFHIMQDCIQRPSLFIQDPDMAQPQGDQIWSQKNAWDEIGGTFDTSEERRPPDIFPMLAAPTACGDQVTRPRRRATLPGEMEASYWSRAAAPVCHKLSGNQCSLSLIIVQVCHERASNIPTQRLNSYVKVLISSKNKTTKGIFFVI